MLLRVFLILVFGLMSLSSICASASASAPTLTQNPDLLPTIPKDAQGVIIVGQAAHLDWDWLVWFSSNVNNIPPIPNRWNSNKSITPQPTDTIFPMATNLLELNPGAYGYHVCEMAYLRRFSQDNPKAWQTMKQFNPSALSIVGGGITSPDNLIPHGEAFLRNYLTGLLWMRSENLTWSETVWLPDDFGHDSQLPVLLDALGAKAVGIARLPSSCGTKGPPLAREVLLDTNSGGLNFKWLGNDGSNVFVYFMPQGYSCGDKLLATTKDCYPNNPKDLAACNCSVTVQTPFQRLQAWYNIRRPLSPTPYIYLDVGADFAMPILGLTQVLNSWNQVVYPKNKVWAVSSQFDVYFNLYQNYLLRSNASNLVKERNYHGSSAATVFKPTPYWTGFYSSRVALKQLHYATARQLLGVEVWSLLFPALHLRGGISQSAIDVLWDDFSPSTHHDFVTGTSTDYTYLGEQLPLLKKSASSSFALRATILNSIVNALPKEKVPGIVAFNQFGIDISAGVSEIVVQDPKVKQGLLHRYGKAIQQSGKNPQALVAILKAPSLGYEIQSSLTPPLSAATAKVSSDGSNVTLENSNMVAVISKGHSWSLISVTDKATGKNILAPGRFGNLLRFRFDGGNIYRYGYEEGCTFDGYKGSVIASNAVVIEDGPIRASVRGQMLFKPYFNSTVHSLPSIYILEYTLVANEPLLRMSVTGSALNTPSIVLTEFDFADTISNYSHGTTYHWDWKQPSAYGMQQDFQLTMEATHDFVAIASPSSSTSWQGVIYHGDIPSWGVQHNSIFGVLLRNSPGVGCQGYGANGWDNTTHTVQYALRLPSGFDINSAHREAASFHTPIMSLPLAAQKEPNKISLPSNLSLASVLPPSTAFITVIKGGSFIPNSVIIRIYSPSNQMEQVTLLLSPLIVSNSSRVQYVSALESRLRDQTGLGVISNGSLSITLKKALTSIQIF